MSKSNRRFNDSPREDPWYEHPLRIVELINDFGEAACVSSDPAGELDDRLAMHANAEHMHTMGQPLSLDTMFFKTSARIKDQPDRLAEHVKIARERGIRVIVYLNVHWGSDKHPEWSQRLANGDLAIAGYGSGLYICANGGFRETAKRLIGDLGRYDIDGVFLDGPMFIQDGCYCDVCRHFLKERYGAEMPTPPFDDRSLYAKWLEFRADSLASFCDEMTTALKCVNPYAILYCNANGLMPPGSTGRDNRKLLRHMEILAAEGGFIFYVQPNKVPIWKPGAAALVK